MTGMILECGGKIMEFYSNWCMQGTKVTWFAGGARGHEIVQHPFIVVIYY